MKKFLIKNSIYLFIFIILANAIAFALNYSFSKSKFYKPLYLSNGFDKNQAFDYIILGSSRGLTTINTKQVDDSLTTSGLNLSMDDTGVKSHLLMLKHFFSSGYKAKHCILTLDDASFNDFPKELSGNDYRFTPLNRHDTFI